MRTLTETYVYMQSHQDAKVEHSDVSNVIHHKFSHRAVSYMLNGENVNLMLEYSMTMHLKVKCQRKVAFANLKAKHQRKVAYKQLFSDA